MSPRKREARERILDAAGDLLANGGRRAVTTRAVSAAAGVQAPTIYRQFGDMRGLLDAVARETLAAQVREQGTRDLSEDPEEDLRQGWDLYVEFGLANPDAFALIYADPGGAGPTVQEGYAVLRGLVARIAEAGRLRVGVDRAVSLLDAAALGVTLTLSATPPEERDPLLAETMREAILAAIARPNSWDTPRRDSEEHQAGDRVATYAIALNTLLSEVPDALSPSEHQLLADWLNRLAGAPSVTEAETKA